MRIKVFAVEAAEYHKLFKLSSRELRLTFISVKVTLALIIIILAKMIMNQSLNLVLYISLLTLFWLICSGFIYFWIKIHGGINHISWVYGILMGPFQMLMPILTFFIEEIEINEEERFHFIPMFVILSSIILSILYLSIDYFLLQ